VNPADATKTKPQKAYQDGDKPYVHGHNEKTNLGEDMYIESIVDNGDGTHTIRPVDWKYSITVDSETGVNAKGTWTFFFDKEDADNYTPPVESTSEYDAGATMKAAIEANPKGKVVYNEDSIVERVNPETENMYTETELYDIFNEKDAFVAYMEELYPNSTTDFSS